MLGSEHPHGSSRRVEFEAIGRFVATSEEVRSKAEDHRQPYGWVEQVLVGQQYTQLGKAARGLVRRCIEKMTGLSRARSTRLIARFTASGRVQVTVYRRRRFTQLYTRADIELLASVDEAHETLSGPATRRILGREVQLYGKQEYVRPVAISVAHLNNLRHHERLLNYTMTRPTAVSIGERRKPQPQGQPGLPFCFTTGTNCHFPSIRRYCLRFTACPSLLSIARRLLPGRYRHEGYFSKVGLRPCAAIVDLIRIDWIVSWTVKAEYQR